LCNTDQGSQFKTNRFTKVLLEEKIVEDAPWTIYS